MDDLARVDQGDPAFDRLGDPAENQAVHQPAEINRAKSAQERRGFAFVAQLDEFDVG